MIVELQEKKIRKVKLTSTTIDTSDKPKIVTGLRLRFIQLRIKLTFLKVITSCYHNPIVWIQSLRYLIRLRRRFLGNNRVQKMVYINGKYHIGLYTPGWNSKEHELYIASQLNDFKQITTHKVK